MGTAQIGLDWAEVQAQKDQLISDLRRARYVDVVATHPGITLIQGTGSFAPDGSLRVGEQSYQADRYVIATGAEPRVPTIAGVEEAAPLTSTTLMEVAKLPKALIVLGGRAVALELGQMMARFGVEVTILQRSGRLVPDHEPEVGRAIAEYLAEDGIHVVTGVQVARLSRDGDERVVHTRVLGPDREFRADQDPACIWEAGQHGRSGSGQGQGRTNRQRRNKVNEYLQTTNPAIYAVGDVTELPEYVCVAAASGTLVAHNAFNDTLTALDLSVVPGSFSPSPRSPPSG